MNAKKVGWVKDEFKEISLGDQRLNERLIKTAELLAIRPSESINRAIEDAADKKAAYRLFDNDKCTSEKIFSVHQKRTMERMSGHRIVLSIHDTTFLNYNGHKATEGLGSIGGPSEENPAQGLIFHAGLAATASGLVLGLQNLKIWSRPKNGIGERSADCKAEEKESYRWITGMREAKKLYSPETQMIFIADREGDMFELFLEAQQTGCDVVIRNKHDRMIIGTDYYLSWHLDRLSDGGTLEVDDTKNNRKAIVKVTYSKIAFNNPKEARAKHLARKDIDRVEMYIVEAKEIDPPEGIEDLHWKLLTTLPVESKEMAEEVIGYYRKRWHIESFYKVFKKGCCDVESCCLQDSDNLEKYLTLFAVIAWRIYWMVHINRISPTAPCTDVLTDLEYKTLHCRSNKTKELPNGPPPSVREVIRLIAKMGGFNGRKGDKEPGMITLWRGWIRLQDMVEMYEIMS